jgi:hypothetical protein
MEQVVIGVDSHKLSATIEVVDRREGLLGSGRFSTDQAGYAAMRRYVRAWPKRVWAVEGANGAGRPLAQRLLEAGEQVLDVRPSWPPGCACSTPGTTARPTPAMPTRLRLSPVLDEQDLESRLALQRLGIGGAQAIIGDEHVDHLEVGVLEHRFRAELGVVGKEHCEPGGIDHGALDGGLGSVGSGESVSERERVGAEEGDIDSQFVQVPERPGVHGRHRCPADPATDHVNGEVRVCRQRERDG